MQDPLGETPHLDEIPPAQIRHFLPATEPFPDFICIGFQELHTEKSCPIWTHRERLPI